MVEHDDARDSGFTLMEMIVVVLLVAVIATVMVAVVAVIVRNAPSTEARTDDSRSYQGLLTWLPRDTASTPPDGFAPPSVPAWSCSGVSGPTLVQMSWSQNGTAYVAGYLLLADGDGKRLTRYTCSGPDTGTTFSNVKNLGVTSRLHDAEAILIDEGGEAVGVTMQLTTCGRPDHQPDCTVPGPVIVVEATSRNPADTLPP